MVFDLEKFFDNIFDKNMEFIITIRSESFHLDKNSRKDFQRFINKNVDDYSADTIYVAINDLIMPGKYIICH